MFTVTTVESASNAFGTIHLPVTMRIVPSGTFTSSGTFNLQGTNISTANMFYDSAQSGPGIVVIGTIAATGLTGFQARYLRANNDTTASVNLSSEL
jgi:hypothetical protein